MRRLLILAPAFPPHPSPATHRARFLARYAGEAGWEVEVLSVRPELYDEQLDSDLARLVPTSARITRVGALPTRLTRTFGIGDLSLRAFFSLRRELARICETSPPDLIFIPGGPFYTFLLGAEMRRRFGVPYVLDFTDPWAFPPMPGQERPWKKGYWSSRLAGALEPRAVRSASHVVAVSDGTNAAIQARNAEVPSSRFSALPFGFESSDFDALRSGTRTSGFWKPDGNLHLAYVGAMLPHGYETLRALFAAVISLREEQPRIGERLRLHFFGTTYDPNATRGLVMPVANQMGLTDVVDEHPRRIPYLDALRVLVAADGILALGSTDHHYTASKIFPCILARRPLLAIYHEASTVCDLMRETGAGELVTYDDVQRAEAKVPGIVSSLARMLSPGGYDSSTVNLAALESYSAARMSGRLFRIFDEVVESEGAAAYPLRAPDAATSRAG